MLLTKPASPVRNLWGPRCDRLRVSYPITESSGETLDNLGLDGAAGDATLIEGTGGPATFGSDSEGNYVDFNGGGAANAYATLRSNSGGASVSYPRGTIVLRWQWPAGVSLSSTRVLLVTGIAGGTAYGLIVQSVSGTGIRVRTTSPTGVVSTADQGAATATETPYTLILRWGEGGWYVWLNGTPLSWDTARPTHAIQTPVGQSWRIASPLTGSSMGLCRLYAAHVFDWPLSDVLIQRVNADPHLPTRPESTRLRLTRAPEVGRAVTDGATLRLVTSQTLTGTCYVRAHVSTDPMMVSGVSTTASVSSATPGAAIDLVLSGLSAATRYYYVVEDSPDDTAWSPLVGGRGTFKTQPASTAYTEAVFLFAGERHLVAKNQSPAEPGTLDTYGRGQDLLASTDGVEKLIANWRGEEAIRDEQDVDLHFENGDRLMNDGICTLPPYAGEEDSGNWESIRFERAGAACNLEQETALKAAKIQVLGNHESEQGYAQQSEQGVAGAHQRQSTRIRKLFVANPKHDTYALGGENQAIHATAGNDWVPSLADQPDPYRADFVDDASGRNAPPLENYCFFEWGNAFFAVLDPFRYTGVADGTGNRERPDQPWDLGPEQWDKLETALETTTAAYKFLVVHHLLDGVEEYDLSGPEGTYYARGSGKSAAGASSTAAGRRLHALCKAHGVTAVIKMHDHRFAHVLRDTVHYVTIPTLAAPTLAVRSSNDAGWPYGNMLAEYGPAQDPEGRQVAEVLAHYNVLGYVLLEMTASGCWVRMVQTAHSLLNADPVDFTTPAHAERWVGPLAAAAGNAVVLDYTPKQVALVADADGSGPDDQFWTDPEGAPLTNLLALPAGYDATEQPWASGTIPLSSTPAGGQVRVLALPRTVYRGRLGAAFENSWSHKHGWW